MSYRLYWGRTPGAFAPEAVLAEIAAPFERVEIDWRNGGTRTPDYLKINPRGQLPALALPDGTVVLESAAIVLTLADRHPEAGLLPSADDTARGLCHRWIVYGAVNLYEVELHQYLGASAAQLDDCDKRLAAAKAKAIDLCWGTIDDALNPGPYLLGTRFSAADIYLAMIAGWQLDNPKMATRRPRVERLVERVRERPKIAPIWHDHYGHKAIFQDYPPSRQATNAAASARISAK